MSNALHITDVTLRDGFQMETKVVSTESKVALLKRLVACGFDRIEITSFVNPEWVPQFQDADLFCEKVSSLHLPCETMAFVPNERGLERCSKFPIPWVSTFIATSEEFNRRNINQTLGETVTELDSLVKGARSLGKKIRIYVSTVFGCPYKGSIDEGHLKSLLFQVARLKPDEIALSDTIGAALPSEVKRVVESFKKVYPVNQLALHLHNTYDMGLANVVAGMEAGITRFDGSTGGIGGCPYAKGASGNLSSEGIGYLLHRLGKRNIDIVALTEASRFLSEGLGLALRSPVVEIIQKGGKLYGL